MTASHIHMHSSHVHSEAFARGGLVQARYNAASGRGKRGMGTEWGGGLDYGYSNVNSKVPVSGHQVRYGTGSGVYETTEESVVGDFSEGTTTFETDSGSRQTGAIALYTLVQRNRNKQREGRGNDDSDPTSELKGHFMTRYRCAGRAFAFVGALCAIGTCSARAQTSLLANGDFESGNFNGWTVANVRDAGDVNTTRNFYIDQPGTATPNGGGAFASFATVANASGGNFYAVSTADAPGQSALLQNFTVPDTFLANVTLSFQLFVTDQSGFGGFVDASGLDYTTGGTFDANQHARVDLLTANAADFTTLSSAVVRNFYIGADGVDLPAPYQTFSFDITANVVRGQTYRLRFAEVDNLSALNMGVDNVTVSVVAVPEHNAGELGLIGLMLVATFHRLSRYGKVSRSA